VVDNLFETLQEREVFLVKDKWTIKEKRLENLERGETGVGLEEASDEETSQQRGPLGREGQKLRKGLKSWKADRGETHKVAY